MSEVSRDTLHEFIESVTRSFSNSSSSSEVLQSTVDIGVETLEADLCVIAEKANGGLKKLVSSPSDWTDSSGLLGPASLPSVVASQGVSYLVDDLTDVRGATETEALARGPPRNIQSLLVVPFGEGRVLIAGDRSKAAFAESDLELLRLLSGFATILEEHQETSSADHALHDQISEAGSALSHDAKNFITTIQGRLELAQEDPQSEHFEAIERATGRLNELIEDTRTLLETGSHVEETEPVQLTEAVFDAWEVEATDQAEIVTGQLEPIIADRSPLCRMLENLFRNAVEHAGPDVTVSVGMLPDEEGFYVEDDGPGIEASERESVLKFAYSTSDDNSGIGLNIVQWIALAHGWDIAITESKHGGTRFEFSGVEIAS